MEKSSLIYSKFFDVFLTFPKLLKKFSNFRHFFEYFSETEKLYYINIDIASLSWDLYNILFILYILIILVCLENCGHFHRKQIYC